MEETNVSVNIFSTENTLSNKAFARDIVRNLEKQGKKVSIRERPGIIEVLQEKTKA